MRTCGPEAKRDIMSSICQNCDVILLSERDTHSDTDSDWTEPSDCTELYDMYVWMYVEYAYAMAPYNGMKDPIETGCVYCGIFLELWKTRKK